MMNNFNPFQNGMNFMGTAQQSPQMNQQMVPFIPVSKERVTENNPPHVLSFMNQYNAKRRHQFNDYWFNRDNEGIIDGIRKVILSCQRDKYFTLRVQSFRVVEDYEEIHRLLQQKYANKTKNGKKQDNPYDYINLRESDIMLLIVRYYIKINRPEDQRRIDPKTKELERLEGEEEIYVCLPRYVNNYYFYIQGNYYAPMFQIVDGSTYNNCTSNSKVQTVTLKTRFMPIKMYREVYDLQDAVTGESVKCALYAIYAFSKKVDALKYILGRYGFYGAMELMEIEHIYIGTMPLDDATFYNFKCRDKYTLISVPKTLFDNDQVTQSIVYTLHKFIFKYEKWDDIFNPRYWNKSLGGDFMSPTLDKGIPVLDSLESIYDIRTRESIRLPDEDKADVYRIIRWMIREFIPLRQKDNLDISTKRARMANEYIDCIYAMKISKSIYRISDKGKNVWYSDVYKAINIPADYVLTNINKSNLISYVNAVNDNDAQLALEYTYKGISGLGDQGGSTVPIIYRSVHPSHLGRVDLDSSSASDPGLSGSLCPMADEFDGSFSDYKEPNDWKSNYTDMMNEFNALQGMKQAIELKKQLGLTYDYVKEDMVKETLETYQKLICPIIDMNGKIDYSQNDGAINYIIRGASNDGVGDIVIGEEDADDDAEEESSSDDE